MSWKIRWSKNSVRDMKKLDGAVKKRIWDAVQKFEKPLLWDNVLFCVLKGVFLRYNYIKNN